MLVVYWIVINRTTLGYEVRSVGFNPEAARYGGISVSRNYFLAMAIAGAFAGLAGAVDITGWEYRIGESDIHASQIGFIGLAAALLGRNTAVGVGFASLLFGALINGTSGRQLDPSIFRPELAGNLTTIIQGLVILFVGLNLGGALARFKRRRRCLMTAITTRIGGIEWTHPRTVGVVGIILGALAFWLALPPLVDAYGRAADRRSGSSRSPPASGRGHAQERRVGGGAIAAGLLGIALGLLATNSSETHLNQVVVWSALGAATLRYATPLTFAAIGGLYCERSGVINVALEGMLLTGAFFGIWAATWAQSWAGSSAWIVGLIAAALAGMALAAIHAVWAIHLKVDQIISGTAINFLALGITGYLFIDKFGDTGTPGNVPDYGIPDVHIAFMDNWYFIGPILGQLNLMIWLSFLLLIGTYIFVFRTPYGLRLRSVGEHPRAADTVGISVYKVRYIAVISSGAIAAMGGAYLSLGFVHSFNEGMTNGIGFIGLAALVFGKWRPFPTYCAALLFGFSSALADRLPNAYGNQWGTLFQALPYALTLIAVAGVVGRSIGPAAAGRPYVKQ